MMDKTDKQKDERSAEKPTKRVIHLDDLDLGDDVVGGASEKLFFGESVTPRNPFDKGISKGFGIEFQDGHD